MLTLFIFIFLIIISIVCLLEFRHVIYGFFFVRVCDSAFTHAYNVDL